MGQSSCSRSRHSILVVDDDPVVRRILRKLIEDEGVDCLEATACAEAVEIAGREAPCAVLVDLRLPDGSGISLCRDLRAGPVAIDLPVALVSAGLTRTDLEAALAAGVSDFIRKPFDTEEIRCRIHFLLRLHMLTLAQRRSLEQVQVIGQTAKDAILMLDGDGLISFWNRSAEEMFGYCPEEALGRNLHQLLAPARFHDAHERAFSVFQKTGQGAAVGKVVDLVGVRKSGEEFPIELSLAATKADGTWSAVGIVRDVTRRRALEEDLRRNEERLRLILDGVPVGITLIGRDRQIRWANQSFRQMTQSDGLPTGAAEPLCPSIRCSSEGRRCPVLDHRQSVVGVERQLVRPDGSSLSVLQSVHEVEFGGEQVLLETLVDLAERKHLELELAHARKLEAVGQLAAGIAHEINTPIQFVGDSVGFLKEVFEAIWELIPTYRQVVMHAGDSERGPVAARCATELERRVDLDYLIDNVPGALDRCDDGVRRVAKIVRAMKEFAHPDGAERRPADLNEAIQSTLVIARNEYKYVADVEVDLGELPPVPCFLGDLNQVILNLIVNAAHAIHEVVAGSGDRGLIRVRTQARGDAVVIEISDTGAGIPEAIRGRVFDPFFTTKPVGQGSGQGLAIARSVVVEKHRGTISFETEAGRGTTFSIRLPLDRVPVSEREGEHEEDPVRR